jgi:hypothetical protein
MLRAWVDDEYDGSNGLNFSGQGPNVQIDMLRAWVRECQSPTFFGTKRLVTDVQSDMLRAWVDAG